MDERRLRYFLFALCFPLTSTHSSRIDTATPRRRVLRHHGNHSARHRILSIGARVTPP